MQYTVALAGSTQRTAQVAETLWKDERFRVSLIVTPKPRPTGRKQILTQNPLHAFADKNSVPAILVDKKLDAGVRDSIEQQFSANPFDFLLIVDFGHLVPKWLLNLPKIAPLNIHPSLLPRWRGASPGQYVLLHGDTDSAVTLMVMNEAFDQGPLVAQLPFAVDPSWTQIEYYQYAFDLMCSKLGGLMEQFAKGELQARPQPKESPTVLADRLSKEDSFRDWTVIQQAMADGTLAAEIERACRAYYPWPKLWTKLPTSQGDKRMIIHRCSVSENNRLVLEQVQLEGKKITSWSEVKNTLLS